MSTGDGFGYHQGRNSEFCVTVVVYFSGCSYVQQEVTAVCVGCEGGGGQYNIFKAVHQRRRTVRGSRPRLGHETSAYTTVDKCYDLLAVSRSRKTAPRIRRIYNPFGFTRISRFG